MWVLEVVELLPGRDAVIFLLRSRGRNDDGPVAICSVVICCPDVATVDEISEVCCLLNDGLNGDGTVEANEARELRYSPVRPMETVRVYVVEVDGVF